MRHIYIDMLDSIYSYNENRQILDIGCSIGTTTIALKKYGRVIGIDYSQPDISFCKKLNKIQYILNTKATYLPFKDESFELITLFQVIEHIEDDQQVVKEAGRVCKRGGYILLVTSSYNFLWSCHDEITEHKRRYYKSQIKTLVKNAGFCIRRLSYINTFLFPIIVVVRLAQRLFYKYINIEQNLKDIANITPIINRVLTTILKIEGLLIKKFNFPFGVSIICLAKK